MNEAKPGEKTAAEKYEAERRKTNFWFHLLYTVIWPFYHLVRPVRAVGRENIPQGPVVVCPNHSTIGDPFYVVYAFGWNCPLRAMAKIQIMQVPFVGWILGKAGVFGVDRGHADMKAVKTSLRYLKGGDKVMVFPEGTRVREGMQVEPKTGAAMFAARTGAMLMPVYVPRKKRLFRPNRVILGEPYYPTFAGRKPTQEELEEMTQDLMARIYALGEGQP